MADSPLEHAELVKKIKGEDAYWQLIRMKGQVAKIPKMQEKVIAKHYRDEARRNQIKRNAGYVGYLEVKNWAEGT